MSYSKAPLALMYLVRSPSSNFGNNNNIWPLKIGATLLIFTTHKQQCTNKFHRLSIQKFSDKALALLPLYILKPKVIPRTILPALILTFCTRSLALKFRIFIQKLFNYSAVHTGARHYLLSTRKFHATLAAYYDGIQPQYLQHKYRQQRVGLCVWGVRAKRTLHSGWGAICNIPPLLGATRAHTQTKPHQARTHIALFALRIE
jgi:hypothetical protein